jgi:hypothetical protein
MWRLIEVLAASSDASPEPQEHVFLPIASLSPSRLDLRIQSSVCCEPSGRSVSLEGTVDAAGYTDSD